MYKVIKSLFMLQYKLLIRIKKFDGMVYMTLWNFHDVASGNGYFFVNLILNKSKWMILAISILIIDVVILLKVVLMWLIAIFVYLLLSYYSTHAWLTKGLVDMWFLMLSNCNTMDYGYYYYWSISTTIWPLNFVGLRFEISLSIKLTEC